MTPKTLEFKPKNGVSPPAPSLRYGFRPAGEAALSRVLFVSRGGDSPRFRGNHLYYHGESGFAAFNPEALFPQDFRVLTFVLIIRADTERGPIGAISRYWTGQGLTIRVLDLPRVFPETQTPLVDGLDFEARVQAVLDQPLATLGTVSSQEREALVVDFPLLERDTLDEGERQLIGALSQYQEGERLVIAIDPGGGKTHRLSLMAQALPPMLVLAPTKKLGMDFFEKVTETHAPEDVTVAMFMGRNEDLCHRLPEVDRFGKARRSIAANLCGACAHGLLTMKDFGSPSAIRELDRRASAGTPVDPDLPRCGYVTQMREIRAAKVLIAAEASLAGNPTHLLARETDPGGPGKRKKTTDRLIVWDDCFTPFAQFTVTLQDVLKWRDRGRAVLDNPLGDDAVRQWVESMGTPIGRLVELLSAHHDNLCLTDAEPPQTLTWLATADLFANYPEEAKSVDGVVLETVRRDADDPARKDIPLRAILDLARAIRTGSAWVSGDTIHCSVPTLSLETFTTRGGIVLDATPSPLVRALAHRVVEIRLQQSSLTVVQDVSQFRGRTALRRADGPSRAAQDLLHMRENFRLDPAQTAVITHLPIASVLRRTQADAFLHVGHWGAHQRGHNDYLDATALILDGVPVPPPEAILRTYESERKYLASRGLSTGAPWSGRRCMAQIECRGTTWSLSRSADPDLDRWVRETITAEVVQAIGRLRGTRRPGQPLTVLIATSFLLAPTYGLEIHRFEGGQTLSWDERYRISLGQRVSGATSSAPPETPLETGGLPAPIQPLRGEPKPRPVRSVGGVA